MNNPSPTVDLGYPTEPRGRIPSFHSVEEEAEWWDTHDSADYDEEFVPVKVTVGPELRRDKTVLPDASTDSREPNAVEGTP